MRPLALLLGMWMVAACAGPGTRREAIAPPTPTVLGLPTLAVPSITAAPTPSPGWPTTVPLPAGAVVSTPTEPLAAAPTRDAAPLPTATAPPGVTLFLPLVSERENQAEAPPAVAVLPSVAPSTPPRPTPTLAAPTVAPATATPPPSPSFSPSPVPAPPSPTAPAFPAAAPPNGSAPPMALRGDLPPMTLRDWPRPSSDNGRCMHFVRNQYFSQQDLETNIARLQQLGAKWTLVVYADENIIHMAAPRFAAAGIVPIWRKMLRPHQPYYDWARDIALVQSYGLPPYFQLYNEPSLGQEWTDGWEGPADQQLFLNHLMQASQDVYNAGGYVGWQFVEPHWLNAAIDEVQRRGGAKLWERFFFVAHPYGENLPPNWNADGRGVLSFRHFVSQLEQRLGFRPMVIAGEGGWRINGQDAPQFPPMDDATHSRYHVELFDWFRAGTVSDGEPLPDELFAYCVWLIAEKGDDNAWWDSFAGDRVQTIQAVSAMPPFVRRFSWER